MHLSISCSLSLSQFDDDAYSTVTHGPRYVPKYERGDSPPPAKPRRTDYDTTAAFRKHDNNYESSGNKTGSGGGLQELDNLLAMLSNTQHHQGN